MIVHKNSSRNNTMRLSRWQERPLWKKADNPCSRARVDRWESPRDTRTYRLSETTESCVILQGEPVCSALSFLLLSLSLSLSATLSHYYTHPQHSNITMRFPGPGGNVSQPLELSLKSVGNAGRPWHKYTRYNLQTLELLFFLPANVCGGIGRSKVADLEHMQQITRHDRFQPVCFHNMEFRHIHLGGITLLIPS